MKIEDVVIGLRYQISGDLQNGNYMTKEDVVRKITRITDKYIVCECGRQFIINENLKIEKF